MFSVSMSHVRCALNQVFCCQKQFKKPLLHTTKLSFNDKFQIMEIKEMIKVESYHSSTSDEIKDAGDRHKDPQAFAERLVGNITMGKSG